MEFWKRGTREGKFVVLFSIYDLNRKICTPSKKFPNFSSCESLRISKETNYYILLKNFISTFHQFLALSKLFSIEEIGHDTPILISHRSFFDYPGWIKEIQYSKNWNQHSSRPSRRNWKKKHIQNFIIPPFIFLFLRLNYPRFLRKSNEINNVITSCDKYQKKEFLDFSALLPTQIVSDISAIKLR